MSSGVHLDKRMKERIKYVKENDHLSLRKLSLRFNLSRSTIWKVLHPKKEGG
jgi:transcriptional regulator with XRE-family HTH domain